MMTGKLQILIIRLSSLGDLLLTTPAIDSIRKALPHAMIDYLVYEQFVELLEHHPELDRVHGFPKNRIIRLFKNRCWGLGFKLLKSALGSIRSKRYDYIIDLHSVTDSALLGLIARGKKRICNRAQILGVLYSKTVKYPLANEKSEIHAATLANLTLLESGLIKETPSIPQLSQGLPPETIERAKMICEGLKGSTKALVGINPEASRDFKRWAPKKFAALADFIHERYGFRTILVGSDHGYLRMVSQLAHSKPRVISYPGLSLSLSLIAGLDFFVSNDTGPMHLAAAFEIPQLAIFGHSNFLKFFPLSSKARAIWKNLPCSPCGEAKARSCPDRICLNSISLNEVRAEFGRLVRENTELCLCAGENS